MLCLIKPQIPPLAPNPCFYDWRRSALSDQLGKGKKSARNPSKSWKLVKIDQSKVEILKFRDQKGPGGKKALKITKINEN